MRQAPNESGPRSVDTAAEHTSALRQITDDLWELTADQPFPGLTTHAYAWRSPAAGNILFYSVVTERDFDALERLGGITHQYLSHRDEAGPMLVALQQRFGARLHAPTKEVDDIATHRQPDELYGERCVDAQGVEVVPAPGHSPGSTCFVVEGAAGRYLFTGDTLYRTAEGSWAAGYLPGVSDREALAASIELLRDLRPDLVVSSAFAGPAGAHEMDEAGWQRCLDEALRSLRGGRP